MTLRRANCGWLCLLLAWLGCDQVATVELPAPPPRPAPELDGGLTWLNSTPLKLADLRGKVVLLDFFEYSCVNCLRTLPYLREWRKRYEDAGLVIIGVHTPQYGFSMDPQNVFSAIRRLGLTYPIVVDSNFAIANAYHNRYWPRKFLIDREGSIRLDHTGEGEYAMVELKIQQLLREIAPDREFPPPMQPVAEVDRPGVVCYPTTPELYLGTLRGQLGNPSTSTNRPPLYTLPAQPRPDVVYLQGEWETAPEYVRHTRDTDRLEDFLFLRYHATELNVVMKPEDIYWSQVFVKLDGDWVRREVAGRDILYDDKGQSYVKVDAPRMYNLVADQPYGAYELQLYSRGKGLSVYSFSFGTCVMPAGVENLKAGKDAR